jgi:hypothetical protein
MYRSHVRRESTFSYGFHVLHLVTLLADRTKPSFDTSQRRIPPPKKTDAPEVCNFGAKSSVAFDGRYENGDFCRGRPLSVGSEVATHGCRWPKFARSGQKLTTAQLADALHR